MSLDLRTRLERAFGDAELPRLGKGLKATVSIISDGAPITIALDEGLPRFVEDAADIEIRAPAEAWAKVLMTPPPPTFHAFTAFALASPAFTISGDPLLIAQARPALERLFECVVASPPALAPEVARDLGQIAGGYHSITCGSDRYDVFVETAGQGIPVLLLHTAGADARQFQAQLSDVELATSWRFFAPDLPFHGRSMPPRDWDGGSYRLSADVYQAWCVAIIEQIIKEPVIVAGGSMGAGMAMVLAGARPDLVRGIVAIEPPFQSKNEQLAVEFNDAHASLRGFANSTLSSSVVLSAGMNPRLYSYFENFEDFFPDASNNLKKKIILKVSDYRSAMIQGNFLAKKGLWVSEYRIESGLNCGGHAFATDGLLLGPIMEEFKQKKDQLIQASHTLMVKALEQKGKPVPQMPLNLKITVQGGVGTAEEHEFLLNHYQVDSVGWGSPFLLVPEATSVDEATRKLLANAKEDDFYTSHISPLGIPFNTVKGTTNEKLKQQRIDKNKAGSSCPKKFLALSKEYSDKGMCMASKKYQDIKLAELNQQKDTISKIDFETAKEAITEKACLCVGLANASFIENNIPIKGQAQGVAVCPGPNLAYFNQVVSLSDMIKHIYGTTSLINIARPNLFIKELQMYVNYFKEQIAASSSDISVAQLKKLYTFKDNLIAGIEYYKKLLSENDFFEHTKNEIQSQLQFHSNVLNTISIPVKN